MQWIRKGNSAEFPTDCGRNYLQNSTRKRAEFNEILSYNNLISFCGMPLHGGLLCNDSATT